MKRASFINHKVTDEGIYIRGLTTPGLTPDVEILVPRDDAEEFGWIDGDTEEPTETSDTETKRLRTIIDTAIFDMEVLVSAHNLDMTQRAFEKVQDILARLKRSVAPKTPEKPVDHEPEWHNMKLSHHVTIEYLVAHCRRCHRPHFAEDIVEQDGILTCKRTGCLVTRLEQPIPIHIHHFSRFRVTVRERVVLQQGALRAGYTFLLSHPQIVEHCLQVSTEKYGVVAIPVSAVEMVPIAEKSLKASRWRRAA